MKSLFLSLILAGSLCAQSPATVSVHAVSPQLLAPGDTLRVYFTLTVTPQTSPGSFNYFNLAYASGPESGAWAFTLAELVAMPVSAVNGVSCFVWSVVLPVNFPRGLCYINGLPFIYGALPTGIPETLPNTESPQYFDLSGNRIAPRSGEIMIERRGNKAKKVVIPL
jgi:hypothetical protein